MKSNVDHRGLSKSVLHWKGQHKKQFSIITTLFELLLIAWYYTGITGLAYIVKENTVLLDFQNPYKL